MQLPHIAPPCERHYGAGVPTPDSLIDIYATSRAHTMGIDRRNAERRLRVSGRRFIALAASDRYPKYSCPTEPQRAAPGKRPMPTDGPDFASMQSVMTQGINQFTSGNSGQGVGVSDVSSSSVFPRPSAPYSRNISTSSDSQLETA